MRFILLTSANFSGVNSLQLVKWCIFSYLWHLLEQFLKKSWNLKLVGLCAIRTRTNSFVVRMISFVVSKTSFVIYRLVLRHLQNVPSTPDHGVFRMPGLIRIFRNIYITNAIFKNWKNDFKDFKKNTILNFIGRITQVWVCGWFNLLF